VTATHLQHPGWCWREVGFHERLDIHALRGLAKS
jgi:hypothetical protein